MRDRKVVLEERAQHWGVMQDITAASVKENRSLTQEEINNYNAAEARMEALDQELTSIDVHEKQSKLEERWKARPENASVNGGGATPDGERTAPDEQELRYAEAFSSWTRHGTEELEPEQRQLLRQRFTSATEFRAQGVGVTTAGGYAVPQLFRNRLIEVQKTFGSVRSVAEVITTETGASLPWPTMDDTANVGAILAENTQVTEQDVALGQASLDVYMYTSKLVRVSVQLIQDSAFDVDSWLPRVLGTRIARIQNQHFTTGTGTGQPEGIQTNATSAVTFPTGNVTSVAYDSLVDLIEAVDPAYQANAAWMVKNSAAFRKLKDSQNRPLWQPALTAQQPDTFLGYPIIRNPDMPTPAASTKSILFGDFREAYVIRDVLALQTMRLTERYADFLQVAFLLFQRSGARPQQTAAYRAATQSAT
jgi:HK97 family phage major capsid protein